MLMYLYSQLAFNILSQHSINQHYLYHPYSSPIEMLHLWKICYMYMHTLLLKVLIPLNLHNTEQLQYRRFEMQREMLQSNLIRESGRHS